MSEIVTTNVSCTEILCMYMGVCTFVCVHAQSCAHLFRGQKLISGVFLYNSPPFFFFFLGRVVHWPETCQFS